MGPTATFAEHYAALSARDARFDGQFIAGVHTTGIYCRPSCSAMTPLAKNVSFYRTAAAAHEAGLRACKRCQPDAVPGSPDWNLTDDLAARAMRLIVDGVIEREGVPGLARRLGYTPRHLGRVLASELGAGPLALARAQRAQNARTLLGSTELSVANVAFAAGFASIRQFNETIRSVYECTPTELRALARRGARPAVAFTHGSSSDISRSAVAPSGASSDLPHTTSLNLRLPARHPFDGAGVMRFLADHRVPGVDITDGLTYERHLRLPSGPGWVRIELDGDAISCSVRVHAITDIPTLVARVRRMFDLDADAIAIAESLASDPILRPLVVENRGLRLPGVMDVHEAVFRTMIGQQISVAAAHTVLGNLARAFQELGLTEPGMFPTAEQLAEHGSGHLRGPQTRISNILTMARALADGSLHLDVGMPSAEFRAALLAMPGIGPWTADYLTMRVLGNPDTLLSTDLVMLQSAAALGLPHSPRALAEYSRRWAPWRSYAGLYLWRARPRTTP